LIRNHPFIDGNKRIGTYILLILLELNNIDTEFTDEDIIQMGIEIANGNMSEKHLLEKILHHSK
jgi:death-on-curing protein